MTNTETVFSLINPLLLSNDIISGIEMISLVNKILVRALLLCPLQTRTIFLFWILQKNTIFHYEYIFAQKGASFPIAYYHGLDYL